VPVTIAGLNLQLLAHVAVHGCAERRHVGSVTAHNAHAARCARRSSAADIHCQNTNQLPMRPCIGLIARMCCQPLAVAASTIDKLRFCCCRCCVSLSATVLLSHQEQRAPRPLVLCTPCPAQRQVAARCRPPLPTWCTAGHSLHLARCSERIPARNKAGRRVCGPPSQCAGYCPCKAMLRPQEMGMCLPSLRLEAWQCLHPPV
jgi:hypothetical protein